MNQSCVFVLACLACCCIVCSVQADEQAAASDKIIAYDAFDYPFGNVGRAGGGEGWTGDWRTSRTAPPAIVDAARGKDGESKSWRGPRSVLIQGARDRNNPLRRQLAKPLTQKEVFVRFDLYYQSDKAAGAPKADPEFFILWLDRLEGGDRSTHSSNTPNIGLHFAERGPQKGRNVFMTRIRPAQTAWSNVSVQPDRPHRIVGRLSKSGDGARADYNRIDLWVDPQPSDLGDPVASTTSSQSVSQIRWIGFSTGRKTEPTDRIQVNNLIIGHTWESVVRDAEQLTSANRPPSHNGVVWEGPVDFREDVYPLLKSRCFDCHAGEKPDSGYRLDVRRELLGYSTGEMLADPGRSRHSRLIELVGAESPEDRMPPEGYDPLTDRQIAMLRAWIDQGLKWDDELLPPPRRKSDHWAFQPIVRVEPPKVEDPSWIRTPVDNFIAKAHAEAGLTSAAPASPRTLARRLYLDLIGLPPTPDQVDEFLDDPSPSAYESLVEQLLNSPHYGERWGRYWLDLARWAESQGYQHDFVRPYAWRYRDYVIDSFNKDKPYDRFLKEQLAGDELEPYADENLIATGFLGAARISGNQEDNNIQRNDVLVDIVNATGSVALGLTFQCAQCHNHKFDPISQRDYYRLQAFFVKGQLGNLALQEETEHPTDMERWIPKSSYAYYSKEVRSLVRKKLFTPAERPHTWGYLSAATGDPRIERLPVVNRKPIPWRPAVLKSAKAHLLIRGDASSFGPPVAPGWPEVLGITPSDLGDKPRSRLADWMADPKNPLVSRVWVNRLWQYHFGRGIVSTASDFGVEGAEPSHPELLDWLATELIESGWSTKHVHRQIVLSSAYRQQQRHHQANAEIDPDNKLLWRWPRRRLQAEAIRDSVLLVTGELDPTLGGVSIPPHREEKNLRRTVYLFQQRSKMPSAMKMFDAPRGVASCSRRAVSTVALQPLFMLNSDFMARRAAALAKLVSETAGGDADRQVQFAFERVLSRSPDAEELAMAKKILQTPDDGAGDNAPLTQLCHALLNLNEFVYLP